MVEAQHPAESLLASHTAAAGADTISGLDQSIVQSLMVPLVLSEY